MSINDGPAKKDSTRTFGGTCKKCDDRARKGRWSWQSFKIYPPWNYNTVKVKATWKLMVGRRSGFLPGRFGLIFKGYLYFWGMSAYFLNFRSEEWGHWWIHHNNRKNIRIYPWKLNPGSLSLKSDIFFPQKEKDGLQTSMFQVPCQCATSIKSHWPITYTSGRVDGVRCPWNLI